MLGAYGELIARGSTAELCSRNSRQQASNPLIQYRGLSRLGAVHVDEVKRRWVALPGICKINQHLSSYVATRWSSNILQLALLEACSLLSTFLAPRRWCHADQDAEPTTLGLRRRCTD